MDARGSVKLCLFLYCCWALATSRLFSSPVHEVRTNYLQWSSVLPAVSVCPLSNPMANLSGLEGFLENLVRPRKKYCFNCKNTTNYPTKGYRNIVKMRGLACRQLFDECTWNGMRLDCCSVFKHLADSAGSCFTINSQLTESRYNLEVSHYAKQGQLYFSTTKNVQTYLHDSKELPSSFLRKSPSLKVADGQRLEVLFGFQETVAESSASMIDLQTRGCILPQELLKYPGVYSQCMCKMKCMAESQARVCGCVYHLLPSLGDAHAPDCNLTGLMCLDKNFGITKKTENKLRKMCEECWPSCEQTDVHIVWEHLSRIKNGSRQMVLSIISPPTEKGVIRSRYQLVDAIVFLACLSRLFTSISTYDVWKILFVRKRLTFRQLHHYDSILF